MRAERFLEKSVLRIEKCSYQHEKKNNGTWFR
jgi:hypothetical protein